MLARTSWEEPPERRLEPAGPVPQGGVHRDDLRQPPWVGRPARRVRLLRGWPTAPPPPSWCRAEDAHRYTRPRRSTSRRLVRRRPQRFGSHRPRVRLHVGSPRCATARLRTPTPRPASPTPSQLAMAEVHDCFTPTELVLMEDLGFAARGTAWKEVLAGTFDRDGELPVNPDGGLKSFGHRGGLGPADVVRVLAPAARGEATLPSARSTRADPSDTRADPQPRGLPPGRCCLLRVVWSATELG